MVYSKEPRLIIGFPCLNCGDCLSPMYSPVFDTVLFRCDDCNVLFKYPYREDGFFEISHEFFIEAGGEEGILDFKKEYPSILKLSQAQVWAAYHAIDPDYWQDQSPHELRPGYIDIEYDHVIGEYFQETVLRIRKGSPAPYLYIQANPIPANEKNPNRFSRRS